MKKTLRILCNLALCTAIGTFYVQAGHGHHHQNNDQYQQNNKNTENNTSNAKTKSTPSSSAGSATNKYDIKVTYTGNHDVGQKLDGGKVVQDPGKAYGTIACGDIAPNELMGGKSPNAKVFEMPAKQHTITIPKGSVPVKDGEYYILDEQGKFIRDPKTGKYKTEKGPHMKCNYAFIGQVGFLGDFPDALTEITIGDSPKDTKFAYGK